MSQLQLTINGTNLHSKELETKLGHLYDGFKSSNDIISSERWAKVDPKGINTKNLSNTMSAFKKVASQVSKEEFVASFMENEIPPVKLSPQEMESLKGGWLKQFCIGAASGLGAASIGGLGIALALELGAEYGKVKEPTSTVTKK